MVSLTFLSFLLLTIGVPFVTTETGGMPPYLTMSELITAAKTDVFPDLNRYYNETGTNRVEAVDTESKGTRAFFGETIWPNGRVPYTLNPNLSRENRIQIALAFYDYHAKTCVRFVPKVESDVDFVDIAMDETLSGWTDICKIGGPQYVKLGAGGDDAKAIIHELGHTVCMEDEVSRTDRDKYIKYEGCDADPMVDPSGYTSPSFYDYFSVMQSRGCGPGDCIQAKQILPNRFCGNTGRLSVLDADKINARYDCQGCFSYRFKDVDELTEEDLGHLVEGGSKADGRAIHICRFYHDGEMVIGKSIVDERACWIPYEGHEFGSIDSDYFEVLINPKNAPLSWKSKSRGDCIPKGAIAGGRRTSTGDSQPEIYYICRCTWALGTGIELIPGKVHAADDRCIVSWGYKTHECDDFEILTCP